jgi:large subunit ribosomal protein L25
MSKAENVIAAQPRSEFGDNASRRLRKSGFIPAVIYSRGKESLHVMLKTEAWQVASAKGANLYTIALEGKEIPAIVKEVQFNHLKNYVYHVDFQAVDMAAEIHASVALHAFGDCYGASHGGVLEQEVHELPVSCRPDALPDVIKVDVTKLQVGETLTVGQLVLPEGVKVRGLEADEIVFHVVLPTQDTAASEEGAAEPEAINEKKAEARAAEKAKK